MGAWEKFQLGWLNYEVARAGRKSEHKLGPMEFNTKQAQGLFVILPKKAMVTNIGAPYAGSYYYYSGAGDNLNNFMYKSFNLAAGATLTAKVRYNIELDWDYAYLVYSTDNGATWTGIQTNLSTTTNPNGQNSGYGITGESSVWVDLTANLPAGNVLLGFRYSTDTNTGGFGFMVDNIGITGFPTDGAETGAGWTFAPTTASPHEWHGDGVLQPLLRGRIPSVQGLRLDPEGGPYYFGYYPAPWPDFVDHFPYQDGLLVNYWDTSQKNNNTALHPGHGLLLPIDAHFKTLYVRWRSSGRTGSRPTTRRSVWSPRTLDNLHSMACCRRFEPACGPRLRRPHLYYDPTNRLGSVIHREDWHPDPRPEHQRPG